MGTEVPVPGSRARAIHEALGHGLSLELVELPAGSFLMGSPRGSGLDDEWPQHRVTVMPFYIGRRPITQEQWRALMGAPNCRFQGPRRPVETVTWKEAGRFCQRLSARTGRAYHLPSESQWEYACRAGTTTPFSFGETLTTDLANFNGEFTYAGGPTGDYRHATTDVGQYPPNAFGLHDMHGNLWEWCADLWHASYGGAPAGGEPWLSAGEPSYRVARGGCWHDTPNVCRSAARLRYNEDEGDEFVGFRVVVRI